MAKSTRKPTFTGQVSAPQRRSGNERPVWQGKSTEKPWRSNVIATFPDAELLFSQRPGAYAHHMRHKPAPPSRFLSSWSQSTSFCRDNDGTRASRYALSRIGAESRETTSRLHFITDILPAFKLPLDGHRIPPWPAGLRISTKNDSSASPYPFTR